MITALNLYWARPKNYLSWPVPSVPKVCFFEHNGQNYLASLNQGVFVIVYAKKHLGDILYDSHEVYFASALKDSRSSMLEPIADFINNGSNCNVHETDFSACHKCNLLFNEVANTFIIHN